VSRTDEEQREGKSKTVEELHATKKNFVAGGGSYHRYQNKPPTGAAARELLKFPSIFGGREGIGAGRGLVNTNIQGGENNNFHKTKGRLYHVELGGGITSTTHPSRLHVRGGGALR